MSIDGSVLTLHAHSYLVSTTTYQINIPLILLILIIFLPKVADYRVGGSLSPSSSG